MVRVYFIPIGINSSTKYINKNILQESMKIPKSFTDEIKKIDSEAEQERLKELEEEKKVKEEWKKYKKNEQKRLKEKIEICKIIFNWKEEFLKTPEGASLFLKSEEHLWAFGGNYAHKIGGHGCWSRIYFEPKTIDYHRGYKWLGGGRKYSFTNPEEMAKRLSYDYLKEFLGEIKSKKIFRGMVRLNG